MNQSIRCEPLSFPLMSDKAVAKGATLFARSENSPEAANPEFDDVLDSEIGDKLAEEEKGRETEAWALFGVAPTVIQILQQEVAFVAIATGGAEPNDISPDDHLLTPEGIEPGRVLDPPVESRPEEGQKPFETQLQSLLDGFKPAEQKLPSARTGVGKLAEQIAVIPLEPAKNASGMVVAQGDSMLTTSHKTEETAPEQMFSLSAEVFEASPNELTGLVKAAPAMRESSPKRDMDLPEFTAIDSVTPEWSSFEGLSEVNDVQSARPSESIEIAQAIRSHVQLLKSSGQEKLDVVLRPDANTELRLHVEKVNGQILVQARCERGDFARLDANWNAIQQTLANQGVRVESLQHGAHFQNEENGNHSPSAFQQHSNSEQKQEQNFIEQKAAAPHGTRQSATNRATVRGWQSWA